jgi:hypothetical protein
MKAFLKTLFGDARNVAVVAVILGVEIALRQSGHVVAAAYLVPPLTLVGIGWLARH